MIQGACKAAKRANPHLRQIGDLGKPWPFAPRNNQSGDLRSQGIGNMVKQRLSFEKRFGLVRSKAARLPACEDSPQNSQKRSLISAAQRARRDDRP